MLTNKVLGRPHFTLSLCHFATLSLPLPTLSLCHFATLSLPLLLVTLSLAHADEARYREWIAEPSSPGNLPATTGQRLGATELAALADKSESPPIPFRPLV